MAKPTKDQQPTTEIVQDAALEQEIRQLQSATKEKPVNPATQQGHKMIFNDLDLKKCPSLKGKNPISLTYTGTDKAKDPSQPEWKNKVWYKKELKPVDAEKDLYQLTLYGDELYSIPVKLVLEGPALEKAIERYRTLLKAHQEKLDLLEKKKTVRQQQQAFRRTVGVSGFGVYNYDILTKEYGTIPLTVDFDFGEVYEDVKEEIDVFLVTGANGMVVRLPEYDWNKFSYNPRWDNKLLAVLPGDKVATFSQSDFDEVAPALEAARGKNYEFKMNVKEQQILTTDDLKEVIAAIEPIAPEQPKRQKAVDVKLYPNPAVEVLNVSTSSLNGQAGRIYLSNNSGQVVKELKIGSFETEPIQLQVGQYPSGPYYVMIMADNKTVATEKLIIQH